MRLGNPAKRTEEMRNAYHILIGIPKSTMRDNAVRIATGYGLHDRRVEVRDYRGFGVRVPVGSRISSLLQRPDRLSSPPRRLSNEYRGELSPG
jgi:hypothetical protein